jgi:hypothetical protein
MAIFTTREAAERFVNDDPFVIEASLPGFTCATGMTWSATPSPSSGAFRA